MTTDHIYEYLNLIYDSAQFLLQSDSLSARQYRHLNAIVSSAGDFAELFAEFETVPLHRVSAELRHNLYNLLTPMMGYAELLATQKSGPLSTEQAKYATFLCKYTNVLRDSVMELGNLARERAAEVMTA